MCLRWKQMLGGAVVLSMLMAGAACGNKNEAQNEQSGMPVQQSENAQPVETTENPVADTQAGQSTEAASEAQPFNNDGLTGESGLLPAYEYPGSEQFYYAVYQYFTEELGQFYTGDDVGIPNICIIDVDETNKDDVLVWGYYEYFTYLVDGDTLIAGSGGAHPGLLHMRLADGSYEAFAFDEVDSGTNNEESAKKIFGSRFSDYQKLSSNPEERNKVRAQIIANYVAANGLDITKYQDFGWDPVVLPAENIDSFYSTLN
ncbi:MAG: hypothetical protein J6M66_05965 [Lachnospiraceae bacterium]|nr:hypothetical protein [Lachnospiraceae bacterium]